jgi:DNA-binding transcriptional ArsR family regulator
MREGAQGKEKEAYVQARSIVQRKKRIGEVVAYALSHRTRVLILIVLNEGVYTPAQVAKIIEEPLRNVSNHIRELAEAGSIELTKSVPKRNSVQHYYRAVEMPYYSEEDMEAMTPEQRDVTYGLVIQSMAAEMMAALWKGTLSSDPKTWLSWRWFNVDAQGREEIAEDLQRSWDRMWEIQAESTNRCAKSKEDTRSILVAHGGFERAKKAARPPGEVTD